MTEEKLKSPVHLGDLNFPGTHWEYHIDRTSKPGKFLQLVEDNFLSHAPSEPARKGALLDLLFESREGLQGEVMAGGCLGHSDTDEIVEHFVEIVQHFWCREQKGQRSCQSGPERANFKLLRQLASSIPWELTLEGLGYMRASHCSRTIF